MGLDHNHPLKTGGSVTVFSCPAKYHDNCHVPVRLQSYIENSLVYEYTGMEAPVKQAVGTNEQ